MPTSAYLLLAVTSLLALFVGLLVTFGVLRFVRAARDTSAASRHRVSESVLVSGALDDLVTRLKAQEQATIARAAAADQLTSQIVNSLSAGLLVVDRDGRVATLNAAGRRLLGVTRETGAAYADLLAGAPALVDLITECLATGTPIVRRALRMPAPGQMHLGVTVSPLEGAQPTNGVICLFSDLTAVMDQEERRRLKESLARLGDLTAGIAHEFRNGLATIHGYSRLIDLEPLPAQYRPYVEGIREETDYMIQVVHDFLAYARPDRMSVDRVPLETVAQWAAGELRRELPPGATVTVDGTFGEIDGDDTLLRQALTNVLRNAAEACAGAQVVPALHVRGELTPDRATCRIVVDDNGPGVPEEDRERVFEPFFTNRARGTGLGLAIVQKIVVLHNGRVGVRAAPAGGASFHLEFPSAAPGAG